MKTKEEEAANNASARIAYALLGVLIVYVMVVIALDKG